MNYAALRALIEQRGCHVLLGPMGEGFGIEQNPHELATFLSSIPTPKTVLEVGTGYKAGLSRFLCYDMGCKVTTVDIQDYGHAARYPEIEFVILEWGGVEYPVFRDRFDLVIIDGDHRYESVKFDLEYYGRYAAQILMFHDIEGLRDCEGVAQWWKEIKGDWLLGFSVRRFEAIDDGETRAGIGWLERL